MSGTGRKLIGRALAALTWAALVAACDPSSALRNQEYATYLEGYERWQATDVVKVFNDLDEHRGEFDCQAEMDAVKRAAWREEPGPVKVDQTPEGKAAQACIQRFAGRIGLKGGPLAASVTQHWVNHNFLPPAQEALDKVVEADQRRLADRGCGGEQCKLLAVVGDLAVARIGQEVAVAYDDALSACDRADFGGLGPWRLPTKAEVVTIRESGEVATDLDLATYWTSSREYDEAGRLQAWVLRFDVQVLGQQVEPKLVPFDRDGVPSLAKVRCVHDLGGQAPAPSDEVGRDEAVLFEAGCKLGWGEYVRRRGDLVVTWKVLSERGRDLTRACKELSWCDLSWRAPGRSEAKTLAEDAWFAESAEGRCVASLPAKR